MVQVGDSFGKKTVIFELKIRASTDYDYATIREDWNTKKVSKRKAMTKTKTARLASRKLVLIILGVLAASLAAWALYIKLTQTSDQVSNPQSDSSPAEGAQSNQGSPSQSATPGSPQAQSPSANTNNSSLPKPTLTKSSGNNGSIPPNVPVNFVCLGEPNLNCSITLTDQANSNHKIDLGTKTLGDERGQAGASFDWTSLSGRWTVVATMSDGSRSSQSLPQTLVVE